MARTPKAEAGATAPADAAAEQAAAVGARVRVRTVSQQPRRRAGIAFGAEPVVLVVADLSDEQVAAIIDDPLLISELHEGDQGTD